MAHSPVEELTDTLKDAAYVSVGLGLIAVQRLQVRRNEITKVLGAALGDRVKLLQERRGGSSSG